MEMTLDSNFKVWHALFMKSKMSQLNKKSVKKKLCPVCESNPCLNSFMNNSTILRCSCYSKAATFYLPMNGLESATHCSEEKTMFLSNLLTKNVFPKTLIPHNTTIMPTPSKLEIIILNALDDYNFS